MKKIYSLVLSMALVTTSLPLWAIGGGGYVPGSLGGGGGDGNDASADLDTLVTYLGNLGGSLGYNITTPKSVDVSTIVGSLLNYSSSTSSSSASSFQKVFEQYAYFTLFGAIPVNSITYPTYANFTDSNYAQLNAWANATFPSYSSTSASGSTSSSVNVNPNIDQPTAQTDPVNQAVLNIIGTPDATFCTNGVSPTCAVSASGCISQNSVMEYVLGDIIQDGMLPGPITAGTSNGIFTYGNSKNFLGSLNTNNLIAPLVYSSSTAGSSTTTGLPSGSQELQASNFIRYAIGTLTETPTISLSDYNTLWSAAYPNPSDTTAQGCTSSNSSSVLNARDKLESYLTSIRVYAARSSVAISNLYAIFSKRIKQTQQGGTSNPGSSQALSEFQMASWRLNNPQNDINNQWVDQINQASSATVQKEIAVLLSEINYQMYLNRQQEERILLTNTMLLIQGLAMSKPTPPVTSDDSEASPTTPPSGG